MTKPKATIGICVRNCETSVKEVINSINDQDFPHELMEVIFNDDGSEDGTLSIISDSVSRMDMQVKVYHSEWKGMGPARNRVVNNASGDYIIWVDGDTTLPRDYVRKLVEFMEQNPAVGVAKGKLGLYPGAGLVATLENVDYVVLGFKYGGKATSKPLGTCGSIYRVKAIKQVGGFDENIKGAGEDVDTAHRIIAADWLIYMTHAVFYDRFKETWKALWKSYFWYGYGLHYVHHKNRSVFPLYEMVPPAAFLEGLLCSFVAYRLTRRKVVFLLPLQYIFKMTAWCLGFIKSHINSYGHAFKT